MPLRDKISRQFTAALSAAVDFTKLIGDAPTIQAEPPMQKQPIQTPATLRERGSGGEALLLEKRPLPQRLPQNVFSRGSAREGPFLQKRPLPRNHNHLFTHSIIYHRFAACDGRRDSQPRSAAEPTLITPFPLVVVPWIGFIVAPRRRKVTFKS